MRLTFHENTMTLFDRNGLREKDAVDLQLTTWTGNAHHHSHDNERNTTIPSHQEHSVLSHQLLLRGHSFIALVMAPCP